MIYLCLAHPCCYWAGIWITLPLWHEIEQASFEIYIYLNCTNNSIFHPSQTAQQHLTTFPSSFFSSTSRLVNRYDFVFLCENTPREVEPVKCFTDCRCLGSFSCFSQRALKVCQCFSFSDDYPFFQPHNLVEGSYHCLLPVGSCLFHFVSLLWTPRKVSSLFVNSRNSVLWQTSQS